MNLKADASADPGKNFPKRLEIRGWVRVMLIRRPSKRESFAAAGRFGCRAVNFIPPRSCTVHGTLLE